MWISKFSQYNVNSIFVVFTQSIRTIYVRNSNRRILHGIPSALGGRGLSLPKPKLSYVPGHKGLRRRVGTLVMAWHGQAELPSMAWLNTKDMYGITLLMRLMTMLSSGDIAAMVKVTVHTTRYVYSNRRAVIDDMRRCNHLLHTWRSRTYHKQIDDHLTTLAYSLLPHAVFQ